MPSHRQLVVEVPSATRNKGSSDSASLQAEYPASPIYNGELTDDTVRSQFVTLVIDGVVDDSGHTFGEFDRDFVDAPNLEEVATGGSGLPGSPYAPNIASPAEGMDPTSIPATGVEATDSARGGGSPFPGNSLASPHETSVVISRQTIGSLKKGTSTPT